MIVLANGEKLAPCDLELAIPLDPLFEQVLVIGDGRPFLAALVVLNQEVFRTLAGGLSVEPQDPGSLRDARLHQALVRRIARQLHAFPGYVQIHGVCPSLAPWTPANGLLTPTLKLGRAEILARFEHQIAGLYVGHG